MRHIKALSLVVLLEVGGVLSSHCVLRLCHNHNPVWKPNTEEACGTVAGGKSGPPGGWLNPAPNGPSQGMLNNALFPPECYGADPPDHCRGWGGGSCMANDCHTTVVEDSGDLAPHGQRWACEVSDCNAREDTGFASQSLNWVFNLQRVDHPRHGDEQNVEDYTNNNDCAPWGTSDFFDDGPIAHFRQDDTCDPPLDNPQCNNGGRTGNGGTGTLQFTTRADRWGSFYFNTYLTDDGAAFPILGGPCNGCAGLCNSSPGGQTCKICRFTILPVNDCPVWSHIGDVVVDEDDNTQGCNSRALPSVPKGDNGVARPYGVCYPGFARGIGAGGWFEWPYQNTFFDCVTHDSSMFTDDGLPRIDGVRKLTEDRCTDCEEDYCQTRSLMFTVRPDQCGETTVTCTLKDDGGTANAGCDQAPPVTFKIKVNCINDPPTFIPAFTTLSVDEDPCDAAQTGAILDNGNHCFDGAYCIPNYATDIKVGPENEQNSGCNAPTCHQKQTHAFVVDVPTGAQGHFLKQPYVDKLGKLCFTLRRHYHTHDTLFAGNTIPLTVTLTDSEGGASSETLNLEVKPVNDVPSFLVNPPHTLISLEDTAVVNEAVLSQICLGGGVAKATTCADFNEADNAAIVQPVGSQTQFWVIKNDNADLFQTQPSLANGLITYTPKPDRNGRAVLDISLCDLPETFTEEERRCSDPQKLIIMVRAVNDAPVLVHAGNIVIDEDCASPLPPCDVQNKDEFFLKGWGTTAGVGGGDDEFKAQNLIVSDLNVADPSLFTADGQPRLEESTDGTGNIAGGRYDLRFTPKPDASGVTNVDLTLKDNGGTEYTGVDTLNVAFTITINEVNDVPFVENGPIADLNIFEDGYATKDANLVNGVEKHAQFFANWAVLRAGPVVEEEAGQTITDITCTDDYLSVPQPEGLTQWTDVYVAGREPTFATTNNLGDLSFTLQQHAFGKTGVSCILTDSAGGVSEPKKFIINVEPVNDPPPFDIAETGVGVNTFHGFLECRATEAIDGMCKRTITAVKNSLPGPPNEMGQGISYKVEIPASNKKYFADVPAPVIDVSTGIMQIYLKVGASTPAAEMNSVENYLFFKLIDDAGGDDTTIKKFFFNVADFNEIPSFVISEFDLETNGVFGYEDENAQKISKFVTLISPGRGEENDASQQLSFTCLSVDTNPTTHFTGQSLLSKIEIDVTTGDLLFTPNANLFGTTEVTCTLSDSQPVNCCFSKTFTLTIINVNDKPHYTPAQIASVDSLGNPVSSTEQIIIFENSGTHTVQISDSISKGAVNEDPIQTIAFFPEVVSVSGTTSTESGFFQASPILNSLGEMTFTVKDNTVGSAEIRLRVKDNGGTLHPGTKNLQHLSHDPFKNGALGEDTGDWMFLNIRVLPRPLLPFLSVTEIMRHLVVLEDAVGRTASDLASGSPLQVYPVWGTIDASRSTAEAPHYVFTFKLKNISYAGATWPPLSTSFLQSPPPAGVAYTEADVTASEEKLFLIKPHASQVKETESAVGLSEVDLAFQGAANAYGVAHYVASLAVQDAGGNIIAGTAPGNNAVDVMIEVLPVNDAPAFEITQPRVVSKEDVSETDFVFPTFLKKASAGPVNENYQTVQFEVSVEDVMSDNLPPSISTALKKNTFFKSFPKVVPAGSGAYDLHYLPSNNVFGVLNMSLCGVDNGGTIRNGVDRTCTFFVIEVVEENDAPIISPQGFPLQNITVKNTAGEVAYPSFINITNGILVGPLDEQQKQQITAIQVISVEPSKENLFILQPTVDTAKGVLRFTVNVNAIGETLLKVTAVDSGGAMKSEFFTVTVLPDLRPPVFSFLTKTVTDSTEQVVHLLGNSAASQDNSVKMFQTEQLDAGFTKSLPLVADLRFVLRNVGAAENVALTADKFFESGLYPNIKDNSELRYRLNRRFFEVNGDTNGEASLLESVQRRVEVTLERASVVLSDVASVGLETSFLNKVKALLQENANRTSEPKTVDIVVTPSVELLSPVLVKTSIAVVDVLESTRKDMPQFFAPNAQTYIFFDYSKLSTTVVCAEHAVVRSYFDEISCPNNEDLTLIPKQYLWGRGEFGCERRTEVVSTISARELREGVKAVLLPLQSLNPEKARFDETLAVSPEETVLFAIAEVNDPPSIAVSRVNGSLPTYLKQDAETKVVVDPPVLQLIEDFPQSNGVVYTPRLYDIREEMNERITSANVGFVTVTITAVSAEGHTAVVAQDSLAIDVLTGDMIFTLIPNTAGNGVFTLSLTERKNGPNEAVTGTAAFSLPYEVLPVNDKPIFDALMQSTTQTTSFTVPYAVNISRGGGADEQGQSLSFAFTLVAAEGIQEAALPAHQTDLDTNVFTNGLHLDTSSGILSAQFTDTTHRVLKYEITLQDNGGTDHGGIDTSEKQTLVLTIGVPTTDNGSPGTPNTPDSLDDILVYLQGLLPPQVTSGVFLAAVKADIETYKAQNGVDLPSPQVLYVAEEDVAAPTGRGAKVLGATDWSSLRFSLAGRTRNESDYWRDVVLRGVSFQGDTTNTTNSSNATEPFPQTNALLGSHAQSLTLTEVTREGNDLDTPSINADVKGRLDRDYDVTDDNSAGKWMWVGILGGIAVVLAALCALGWYCHRKRQRAKYAKEHGSRVGSESQSPQRHNEAPSMSQPGSPQSASQGYGYGDSTVQENPLPRVFSPQGSPQGSPPVYGTPVYPPPTLVGK